MCGIAGKLHLTSGTEAGRHEIEAMLAPIAHRGPDGTGVYLDGPVGLGHRRLAIIDLSTGDQPMANEDETVWIVFNGEIYNYQSLQQDMLSRGHKFRSKSDTETIIHLYEEYGVDCVKHLRGMFAFAIWDKRRRRLFIARDRVGIKPVYYCQTSDSLLFASELKALLTDHAVSREVNYNAMRRFFSFYYLPGEETLFSSIRKLAPGHHLVAEGGNVTIQRYWDLKFTTERWTHSFEDVVTELHDLLHDTVRDHMVADVPVGVLLSGGVDSSAVLSFAVQGTAKKVNTFTIGFASDLIVDERPYARLAAKRFGTEHHELSFTSEDFWSYLPSYVWHMEEPVCEPPAVALHFISELARQHVKVVLSGEGGDEAFAGYPNYPNMLLLDRISRGLYPLARSIGSIASWTGMKFGLGRIQRYGDAMGRPVCDHYYSRTSAPSTIFNQRSASLFSKNFLRDTAGHAPDKFIRNLLHSTTDLPLLDQMLYVDTMTWLPDDLLIKADKMTMANSIELRVPLLDHKILEFAASLPENFKVRGRETKRALKTVFHKILPKEILTRKKAGFPVPYSRWLQGPLSERVRALLLSERATQRGYFHDGQVECLINANNKCGTYSKEIFSLIVFELWHRQFVDAGSSSSNL